MVSATKHNFHTRMLNAAIEVAHEGDLSRHNVGSLLVFRKTIISSGFSQKKTHPIQASNSQYREEGKRERSYVHAEVNCISKVRRIPKDAVLYIGRIQRDGSHGMARPCAGCMEEIRRLKIRHLVYTTNDGYACEELNYEE